MNGKLDKIGIVTHDAGGAEILSSFVCRQNAEYYFSIAGPAEKIFKRKIGDIRVYSLREMVELSDWVLCGTSWQSDLELRAIEISKEAGKKVISFIDHWVNYKSRFIRKDVMLLPDEIWVGDEHAFELATSLFKNTTIRMMGNPAFEDFISSYKQVKKSKKLIKENNLLFLSDNIEESLKLQFGNGRLWGYADKDSFEYMMQNIEIIDSVINKVTIRKHPSERLDNYLCELKQYSPLVVMSGNDSLAEDLSTHDIVVGSESMAMVYSVLCGKRTICSIPPSGKKSSIPYSEIKLLSDLKNNALKVT